MFDQLVKAFAGAALAVALGTAAVPGLCAQSSAPAQGAPAQAAPAAPAQPKVKDQGEYDALTAAQKETDPVKKLALLKAWQDKYPDSEFKGARLLQFMNTWSQIATKTLGTTPTPDSLAQGKDAGKGLLDNLSAFAPENKPAGVSDDQWKGAKAQVEQLGHMTLGWVALQNKDFPTAETEFKTYVGLNDQNAQAAYWLGTAIYSQHKIERTPEALYQFARAMAITGPAALSPDSKKTTDAYLTKAWNGYHGDDDPKGLTDFKDLASKAALPPADIDTTIKTVVQREKEKAGSEEQYLAQHPDIKLWRDLKAALTAPDGDDYFTKNLKGAQIPQEFNAKILSWTPETAPTEIKITIDDADGTAGDAILKYEKPLKAKLEAGMALQIKGTAVAYVKDPFTLTFSGDESEIKGLPVEKVAPKPKPKAPVRRKKTS